MTIKKLLISNRGEIASRIIKSAHDMGITCVAIYTEADKNTPYVREADQSFKLSDSYLNAQEILEIAKNPNDFDDYKITDLFYNELEKLILEEPSFYFWTHNRFKLRKSSS